MNRQDSLPLNKTVPPPPLGSLSSLSGGSSASSSTATEEERLPARPSARQLVRRQSSGATSTLRSLVADLRLDEVRSSSRSQPSSPRPRLTPEHCPARAPPSAESEVKKRELFLVFVRILFKCLDDHRSSVNDIIRLRTDAKRIVRECTLRNRSGDPAYMPLVDVLEKRLRELDGMEVHWHKAKGYLGHFMMMRGCLMGDAKGKGKTQPSRGVVSAAARRIDVVW